jgi:hypothetical protein
MANDWARRFGKARAAKDRAILKEAENWNPDTAPVHQIDEPMRQRIIEATERERIARAFGRPKDVWQ